MGSSPATDWTYMRKLAVSNAGLLRYRTLVKFSEYVCGIDLKMIDLFSKKQKFIKITLNCIMT